METSKFGSGKKREVDKNMAHFIISKEEELITHFEGADGDGRNELEFDFISGRGSEKVPSA